LKNDSQICVLSAFFVVLSCSVPARAQSQSQQSSQPSSQRQSQSQSQPASQSQAQSQTQMQVMPGAQQESLADAARKAKAKKAQSSTPKVMTEDDLSGLGGHGVSVVGDGNSGARGTGEAQNFAVSGDAGNPAPAGTNDEKYWRGRARQIMDEIAATDQQIEKLKVEIAKSGPTGMDPSTGLTQNVIIIHDRNAQMQQLEDRKERLQKQLDDLADEGRKAGADSSWFR
jgi:hypothetical protein